jgi:hypothetical protein
MKYYIDFEIIQYSPISLQDNELHCSWVGQFTSNRIMSSLLSAFDTLQGISNWRIQNQDLN